MELNKETLEHIHGLNVAMALNSEMACEELPMVALPNDLKLESIEHLMPAPVFFKGKFTTGHLNEFTRYCLQQSRAEVFVNQDKMSAIASFDHGTPAEPEHRYHQAGLTLKATPEYKKLQDIDSAQLSQKAMVELLEDYHANIQVLGKESIPGAEAPAIDLVAAITAVRNTTVKTDVEANTLIEDFSEHSSTFANQEISNRGHNPVYIDWTCTPYTGLKLPLQAPNQQDDENESRTFRLRISTITNGEKVAYSLRVIQFDTHKQVMAEAFKAQLENELIGDYQVRIGSFQL